MALLNTNLLAPAVLAASLSAALGAQAQIPTKCLEIESILVDACISETDCPGSTEGMNEMVRFITGPAPISLSNLVFTFYSSTFRGIVQNAATASLTAQLNATIQGCGHLVEPPAGVIPAGKRVIFITSTNMCVQANPFTNLNDTLYIIFQAPGNSQGHFRNSDMVGQPVTTTPGPPMMRWLRMSVTGTACGDTATYDANQLVNVYGTYGGTSAENDGATANFTWPGQPVVSYVNYGCQAPFVPTLVSVPGGGGSIACGGTAALAGVVSGAHVSVLWRGGAGSFGDAHALATTYTPGNGESGPVALSFCAITACNDTICTQVVVTIDGGGAVAVSHTVLDGCATHCITFAATSAVGNSYLWDFGDDSFSSDSSAAHCYTIPGQYTATLVVQQSNGCPDLQRTVGPFTISPSPTAHFSWSPQAPTVADPQVQFTDESSGATVWAWLFGDPAGSISTQASPAFTFPGAGCYPVTFAVMNAAGCADTTTALVCIAAHADSLVVPNVFSPNGDGHNDTFRVTGGNLASLDVQVFNRWGQKVARMERIHQAWDGRSAAGEVLPEGTYFYLLHAVAADGKVYDLHGTVTLLR